MEALIVSLPPSAVDDERVVGAFRPADVDLRGKAGDRDRAAVPDDGDLRVVAVGAVDGHRVGLRVAGAAGRRQVDLDGLHVGAGEVVDREGVGAAERVELDRLDVVRGP